MRVERRPSLRLAWFLVTGAKGKKGEEQAVLWIQSRKVAWVPRFQNNGKEKSLAKDLRPSDSVNAGCTLVCRLPVVGNSQERVFVPSYSTPRSRQACFLLSPPAAQSPSNLSLPRGHCALGSQFPTDPSLWTHLEQNLGFSSFVLHPMSYQNLSPRTSWLSICLWTENWRQC